MALADFTTPHLAIMASTSKPFNYSEWPPTLKEGYPGLNRVVTVLFSQPNKRKSAKDIAALGAESSTYSRKISGLRFLKWHASTLYLGVYSFITAFYRDQIGITDHPLASLSTALGFGLMCLFFVLGIRFAQRGAVNPVLKNIVDQAVAPSYRRSIFNNESEPDLKRHKSVQKIANVFMFQGAFGAIFFTGAFVAFSYQYLLSPHVWVVVMTAWAILCVTDSSANYLHAIALASFEFRIISSIARRFASELSDGTLSLREALLGHGILKNLISGTHTAWSTYFFFVMMANLSGLLLLGYSFLENGKWEVGVFALVLMVSMVKILGASSMPASACAKLPPAASKLCLHSVAHAEEQGILGVLRDSDYSSDGDSLLDYATPQSQSPRTQMRNQHTAKVSPAHAGEGEVTVAVDGGDGDGASAVEMKPLPKPKPSPSATRSSTVTSLHSLSGSSKGKVMSVDQSSMLMNYVNAQEHQMAFTIGDVRITRQLVGQLLYVSVAAITLLLRSGLSGILGV